MPRRRRRRAEPRLLAAVLCAGCAAAPARTWPPPHGPAPLAPALVISETWPMPLPPVPTRREPIAETLHGVLVEDPYRWLEAAESPEVSAWIGAQNAHLEATLAGVPVRERLRARLTELLEIGSISVPALRRTGDGKIRLFYTRREGRQNQPVLYVRDGFDGAERALVDPNAANAAGTTALDWYEPSKDGRLLAYGTSQSGSEDSTLRIRDVASGRDLPDVIERTRHASLAWTPDGARLFYTRYPKPGSVPAGEERYHRKLFEHRLGTAPDTDPLVFAPERPTDFVGGDLSPDGRFLLVTVSRGWSESALYLADLRAKTREFRRITPQGDNRYFATPREDALYVITNEGAPRYRLFRVDPNDSARERWRELLPEHPRDVLESFEVAGNDLLAAYLEAGASRLERFSLEGATKGPIALPTIGSSSGFSALPDGKDAFFAFESFARPPEIRRLELASGREAVWESVRADIPVEDYAVESLSARSRDGTPVPYRLVHRRDLDLASGKNPTLLYGYGGFNESLEPRFSRASFAFLEQGGVYVQANLRGGGEFGEAWHKAGQLERKQNTFDDFIAVAEDLLRRRVTDSAHLAIHGRSNGGLLVAAVVTQRPELFRAAVAGVPLTDMVRYPRFLIAKLWVPEYGSPDDPAQFRALHAYSPYHRVQAGTPYPALLVTTAESDTRVDPLHARKFVAAVQHASSSRRSVLLRTEREAGHGAGTPVSKLVGELTDFYAFLFAELGMAAEPRADASGPDKR